MMLDTTLVADLRKTQAQLDAAGELPAKAQLDAYYQAFRQRFGPDRLKSLDGEALLSAMHDHTNHDSLVYWLEFKDDEEMPALFGSIAGGSALKFGIYRRRETGAWMSGSPQKQYEVPLDEAVSTSPPINAFT